MSDKYSNDYGTSGRGTGPYSRYSRSAGVGSYHRRRHQSIVFRSVIMAMLTVVLGGALFLLGRHYFAPPAPQPEPTEEETAAPAKKDTAKPAEITLVAAGDVIMNSSAVESGAKESGAYGFDHLFTHVAEEISSYDVRIVSQETNLPGSKFGFGSTDPLNAPQELGRAEMSAGFNVVLRASDHTLDNGYEGLHNELQWWDSEYPDTPLLGVSEPNLEENPGLSNYVDNVYFFEKDDFKIAILNHTWGVGDEDNGVLSSLSEDKIAADVQKARDEGAELIVACPHWGMENSTEPSEEETTFAQVYANNGVDLVIGTHPRVLQPVEVIEGEGGKRTVCFYSLGCLLSSLNSDNLIGGLAEVTLSRDENGACSVTSARLRPVVTRRGTGEEFSVYPLSQYDDEVAQGSWDYLTVEAVNARCAEILGDGYNTDEELYTVSL